jgi:hypothetical protein
VGLGVGVALRGGGWRPQGASSFLPLHLEARGDVWPLGHAFREVAPYAFLAAGVAQMDTVMERPNDGSAIQEDGTFPAPSSQPDKNDLPYQNLDVLHRGGKEFAALGIGSFFALSGSFGLVAELRGSLLFPSVAFAFTPSLGATYGF